MTDLSDKLYIATGLTLNAEAVAAIGRMLEKTRDTALEEAAHLIEQMIELDCPRKYLSSFIRLIKVGPPGSLPPDVAAALQSELSPACHPSEGA
jgi:hypothetical protein